MERKCSGLEAVATTADGWTLVLRAVDYFEVTFVVGHTALLPESTR